MSKGILLATFLSAVTATFWCVGVCRSDDSKTTEVGVADLLKLPDEDDYKVDPYLRAAQSLQAMGEEKACKLLADLAVKQTRSETRTVTLCRMLFKAKSGGAFRRPLLGGPCFLAGGADANDWPLEPITIVDGVPFRVVRGYTLAGRAESSASYLVYCLVTVQPIFLYACIYAIMSISYDLAQIRGAKTPSKRSLYWILLNLAMLLLTNL